MSNASNKTEHPNRKPDRSHPPDDPAPKTPLQRRAARGSALALINHTLTLALNVGTTLILATRLGREDFGLVAIAFSIQSLLLTIRDGGFANALIQKRDMSEVHINSVFWFNVVVATIISALVAAFARPIATLYDRPELAPILWLMIITIVGHALGGVQDARLRKNIQFGRLLWVDVGSIGLASLAAVVAVFLGAGVWSLVIRLILGPVLYALFCWLMSPWRPRRQFRWAAIRSLWSFGSYLFLGTLLGFGLSQLDNPLVGKLLGISAAGTLFLSRQLVVRTMTNIAQAVGRVMYPVFSAIQDDPARIRSGYLTGTRCLAVLMFAAVGGIVALAPEIISLVLGEEWQPTIPVLQVLSLQGLLISVTFPAAQILNARGKSKTVFGCGAIQGVAVVLSFVVGCRWGIVGVAASWTLARFLFGPLVLWFAAREVGLGTVTILGNVTRPFMAAVVAVAAVRVTHELWGRFGHDVNLALLGWELAVGFAVYGAGCALLLKSDVRMLIRELWTSRGLHATG